MSTHVLGRYGFKKDMDTSVHIQNFFLYFYGFLVNAVGVLASWALARRGSAALFSGINGWVLLLVAINAAQGSLASFFYKFAVRPPPPAWHNTCAGVPADTYRIHCLLVPLPSWQLSWFASVKVVSLRHCFWCAGSHLPACTIRSCSCRIPY